MRPAVNRGGVGVVISEVKSRWEEVREVDARV